MGERGTGTSSLAVLYFNEGWETAMKLKLALKDKEDQEVEHLQRSSNPRTEIVSKVNEDEPDKKARIT